jgi:hypothetical protein
MNGLTSILGEAKRDIYDLGTANHRQINLSRTGTDS